MYGGRTDRCLAATSQSDGSDKRRMRCKSHRRIEHRDAVCGEERRTLFPAEGHQTDNIYHVDPVARRRVAGLTWAFAEPRWEPLSDHVAQFL